MCDFCGSLTDIDFEVGMEKWNESSFNQIWYTVRKAMYMQQFQAALSSGNKDAYYLAQREYWDFYYRSFPAYLPPTVDSSAEYQLYLNVCAESSTMTAFDPKWTGYGRHQQQLQAKIKYAILNGERKVEEREFFDLVDFFVEISKEGMREFYENPRYEIMSELLPESVHLKMRTSMFVQAWLPYLTDQTVTRLLDKLDLSNEYVEMEQPPGEHLPCTNCRSQLFAPEGSYRVYCENCRRTSPVRTVFYCSSCGGQNAVPEDPAKPIACERCGVANRLIRPHFG